jgi:hypothetical protein
MRGGIALFDLHYATAAEVQGAADVRHVPWHKVPHSPYESQ